MAQNVCKNSFSGDESRKNCIPVIKYGTCILSFDEYISIGTHWKHLYDDNAIFLMVLELIIFQKKSRYS